ncbi:unnamed protein product [Auanema sp. JU1783]|nr:unnamed protein product [Auanema sp. JU1783]
MSKKVLIDLFYDVISPYSLLGFEGLVRYQKVWPINLRLRPFFFPAVVKHNPGAPMLIDIKAKYTLIDVPRAAESYKIPFKFPENFKDIAIGKSAIKAQRVLNVLNQQSTDLEIAVARGLWRRFFYEGAGIFENEDIMKVMKEAGVSNPEDIIKQSNSETNKKRLVDTTNEAMEYGCFGAPWITVHTDHGLEQFFGSDRLPVIAHMIGQKYIGPCP